MLGAAVAYTCASPVHQQQLNSSAAVAGQRLQVSCGPRTTAALIRQGTRQRTCAGKLPGGRKGLLVICCCFVKARFSARFDHCAV